MDLSYTSMKPEALKPFYNVGVSDRTLVFESRFECGNLSMASKVSDSEYNLLLQNDVNSKGHTQWFFFKVTNTTKDLRVKFNILNLVKGASLYNQGMQIAIHSQAGLLSEGQGWFRGGDEISYFPNNYRRENVFSKTYFTMTFSYTFLESHDTVYFAYSVPYTYTQLNEFLKAIEADPLRSQFVTRKTMCRTLAGNKCEYLTITNPGSIEEIETRRGIVVSARVHPGETVGSWMMHGLINFLTSAAPEANQLRDRFLVKVVPMLNPDGVVNGNHRTSLTGADLNRRWKYPSKLVHPTIYSMKRMIKSFASKTDLEIITDFHGHSRKKNVFIYGCNIPKEPEACKLFPYILSKINPNFSFKDCRFGIQKAKEATLRVSLFKELKIPKVYTVESSFAGPDSGPQAHTHFTTTQLEEIGRDFLLAVLVCNPSKLPPKLSSSLRSNRAKTLRRTVEDAQDVADYSFLGTGINVENLCAELLQDQDLREAGEEACSSDDSDSEPSEDNLEVAKLNKLMPKEVRIKHRSLPRANSKKRANMKPAAPLPVTAKKCLECGEIVSKLHTCNPPQPAPPAAPPPPLPRKPIGVRTYYNKFGKKVHDQITQTPNSFYAKHVLRTRRPESFSRGPPVEEDSQNADSRNSVEQSTRLEGEIKDLEGLISGISKPPSSGKWRTPVISARNSMNASPTKRAMQDPLKQKSIFNSQRHVPNRGIYSRMSVKSKAAKREDI